MPDWRVEMSNRIALPLALLLAVFCAFAADGIVSTATAQNRSSDAGQWEVPRTVDGHPDLQGNWTNVTLTPFQRRQDQGPVYTPEQVQEIEQPDGDCPANPGTVPCRRPESTTGSAEVRLRGQEYSEVYWDRGSRIAIVNGEYRTSLITNPANGRRPPLTTEGQRRLQENREIRGQFNQYDHPELRPLIERCLLFDQNAGPPMLPNGGYNNNYTIIQTAHYVMIYAEVVHDARIIQLEKRPRSEEHTSELQSPE